MKVASAIGGAVFSFGSLFLFGAPNALLMDFITASPLLVYMLTVGLEYLAGTRVWSLPRTWKTVLVIAAANVPSADLALFAITRMSTHSIIGHG